jgi:uncharacterized membrane protein YgdD (TMEM256/DUF423 family)
MPAAPSKPWLLLGALLAGLAVAFGAFGAHGLKSALRKQSATSSADEAAITKKLENWETAARYQMYQGLALFGLGLLGAHHCGRCLHLAGTAMAVGTLLFSGGLYGLVLSGQMWLAHIVPIGGVLLIVGWVCLTISILTHRSAPPPAAVR